MTASQLETMELVIDKDIAVITFTRESALNAMNQTFFDNFSKLMVDLNSRSDIKALIITGKGNGFSVGADVSIGVSGQA